MILPLTNNPEETFSVAVFGIVYNFKQLWNEYGFWTLDIKTADNIVLVYGVKIITGELLLKQYPQIPFDLTGSNGSDPTRDNLDSFFLSVVDKNV